MTDGSWGPPLDNANLPRLGFQPVGRRAERVLLVCAYNPAAPDACSAFAAEIQRSSAFGVTVVNAWDIAEDALAALCAPDRRQPFRRFDALLLCEPSVHLPVLSVLEGFAGPKILLAPRHAVVRSGFEWLTAASPVSEIDAAVDSALAARGMFVDPVWASDRTGRNVLVLVHHRPQQDPRLGWLAAGAPSDLVVHQLGMRGTADGDITTEVDARGGLVQCLPRARYLSGEVLHWRRLATTSAAIAAVDRLQWMAGTAWLSAAEFCALSGSWAAGQRAVELQWLFRYVLDLTAGMVRHVSAMRHVDAIIAADVLVLPAAYLLGAIFGVPVIVDAHEYWPEADLASAPFEQQFWRDFEAMLVPHAALRITVSTGLAECMSRSYGVPFMTVPNAEPRAALLPGPATRQAGASCKFLVQGGFAPGRGFELLIEAWPRVTGAAHLILRGPDSEYRQRMMELARTTGLLGRRIFFPEAVLETELIASAALADVGVLPYEPKGRNHVHCCPNKLSQYMAAGLPLLANRTEFVREVVEASASGLVVDFRDQDALVAAVDRLAADGALRESFASRSREYFTQSFHWETLSAKFYQELSGLCASGPARRLQLFGSTYGVGDNGGFAAAHAAELETARKAARSPANLTRRIVLRLWRELAGPVKRMLGSLKARSQTDGA